MWFSQPHVSQQLKHNLHVIFCMYIQLERVCTNCLLPIKTMLMTFPACPVLGAIASHVAAVVAADTAEHVVSVTAGLGGLPDPGVQGHCRRSPSQRQGQPRALAPCSTQDMCKVRR